MRRDTIFIAACRKLTHSLIILSPTHHRFGMCEALFKPDMEPDVLFETLAQALLSSVDRDAMSGWGGVVHIITKEGVTTKELKGRQD